MPCLCIKCHQPCDCGEYLCEQCFIEAINDPTFEWEEENNGSNREVQYPVQDKPEV